MESLKLSSVRTSISEELTRDHDIEVIWREYFVDMLNCDEVNEVGGDARRARIGEKERIIRKVVLEEIMGALKKIKSGKTNWYM